MENVFIRHFKSHNQFAWGRMGDVDEGRPTLGESCPIIVYRLMEQTLLDVLSSKLGRTRAQEHFEDAGIIAGYDLAMHRLVLEAPPEQFFANLTEAFAEMRMGQLTVEQYSPQTGEITILLAGRPDCSMNAEGNQSIAYYSRGIMSGIMKAYSGLPYGFNVSVSETNPCTCRLHGLPQTSENAS